MPHFNGNTPNCKIHTTRGGTCSKKPCGYQENAKKAPSAKAHNHSPWEAHHLLPFESINAYGSIDDYKSCSLEIDATYRRTEWCLNQPANLIPLPLRATYKHDAASRSLDLPCHNMHHNCKLGYRYEVTEMLKSMVWNRIKDAVDNSPPGSAHYSEQSVLAAFQTLEYHFRSELVYKRGKRGPVGSTAVGILAGYNAQGSMTNGWWLPFSMARTFIAMSRPRLLL
jgi:hypothetical protein